MTTFNPVPNSVGMQISYKKYADANIYPGTQPVMTADPGVNGAQQLRRVGSTLSPTKATFKSNEIRPDQQMIDFRHGARKMAGDISGELSPKTWQDFFSAVVRGNWAAGVTASQADFTSVTATASSSKFTVNTSDWATKLFKVGDIIRFAGITGANLGVNFTIVSISTVDAVVYPAPADMGSDSTFTVAVVGRKVQPPSVPIKTKWAFEQYYSDAAVAHLFTECRISSVKVSVPASGIPTITTSIMGRDVHQYGAGTGDEGTAPFFTTPTAPTDSQLLGSFGGALLVGGVPIAVITSADVAIDVSASTVDAAFNTLTPEIFTGVLNASGSVTALFEDNTLLHYFMDETEVSLVLTLTTANSTTADFVSFFMPRVKLSSSNFANSGEQGIPVTIGFQAIKKATATGFDPATIVIQDSLSA